MENKPNCKNILDYLKQYDVNITEVINFKVKDYNDEYGTAGKHLEVICHRTVRCPSFIVQWKTTVRRCLVSIEPLYDFIEKANSVIWLP